MTAVRWSKAKRRWRRFVLRSQGRLDGERADQVLPWILAGALFVVLLALEAAIMRSGQGGSGLGPWLQSAWRRRHDGAGSPVAGTDPATGAWSVVAEPLLFLTRWIPARAVFAVVQSAAIAIAVVPLWRIAREIARLRVSATATVIAVYALAPTLHRTNLSAFHPEVIALPALLWAFLEARRGHVKRYAFLVVLVLACRADLALTVVALGIVLVTTGERRLGAITILGALTWAVVAVAVLDPQVPSTELTPAGEFVARTVAPLAELPRLFLHPIISARELLAEESVLFLVVVLAPVLFLPLVAPRVLFPALACLGLAMIADRAVQRSAQRGVVDLSPAAAHVAPAMAFVFIALVYALERVGTRSITRVNVDKRVLLALLAGAALLFVTEAPTSPYRRPWAWGSRDAIVGARVEASEMVGPDDAVAVSPQTTAMVAERARLVELPLRPEDLTDARIARIAPRVDAVLLDTNGIDAITRQPRWPGNQRRRVLGTFAAEGFAIDYRAQGVYLLRVSDG